MDKGINNGFLSIFMTNSWGITGILMSKTNGDGRGGGVTMKDTLFFTS